MDVTEQCKIVQGCDMPGATWLVQTLLLGDLSAAIMHNGLVPVGKSAAARNPAGHPVFLPL